MIVHPNAFSIPRYLTEEISAFQEKGVPPGEFIGCLLCNDLIKTLVAAKREELKCLPDVMAYVHANLPLECYGSKEDVNTWIAFKLQKEEVPLAVLKLQNSQLSKYEKITYQAALQSGMLVLEELLKNKEEPFLRQIHDKMKFAHNGQIKESLEIKVNP